MSFSSADDRLAIGRTALVGREEETADVIELLARSRLLTLVGEGGRGKTRLATRVVEDVRSRYLDGAWTVELAGIRDGTPLAGALASVLEIRETPGFPIETSLVSGIGERRMLVVLDNCEHVSAEASRLAEVLMRECPGVSLLATSREPLGARDESVYRLEGLATPVGGVLPTPTALGRWGSVRLFVDRLTVAQPHFALTESNATAVAQVCRALDGAPLALEIAAARASSTSVEGIATSLLARGGARTAGTLDDLVGWSYEQLDPIQRTVLRTCGVFVGGWDLPAAEAVVGAAHPSVEASELKGVLSGLVAEALVIADVAGSRFRLLETVRQSIWRRAERADEALRLRGAHARWYAQWAGGPSRDLLGPRQVEAAERIETEHDNLRASHAYLVEDGDTERAQRLVADLSTFRENRGFLSEGAARGLETLDLGESDARLPATIGTARLLFLRGDPKAHGVYEDALRRARLAKDARAEADAEQGLGNILFWQRDVRTAEAHFLEAYALRRDLGDAAGIASCLHSLGNVRLRDDRLAEAAALFEQALATRRDLGDVRGVTMTLGALSQLALACGDDDEAVRLTREGVLRLSDLRLRWVLALNLTSLLRVAERRGDLRWASILAGARARVRETTGFPVPEVERADVVASLAALRERYGKAAYDVAYAEGYSKDWNEAVALSLA